MDSGKPVETITPQNMKRLYGFDVEIVNSNGRYFILPPENL
jgi:ABC-type cobalamin/Fe3+-siderophores transport system ATPase subunit